jgi:hypothetical protein
MRELRGWLSGLLFGGSLKSQSVPAKLYPLRSNLIENDVLADEDTVGYREILLQVEIVCLRKLSLYFLSFPIDLFPNLSGVVSSFLPSGKLPELVKRISLTKFSKR